MSEIPVFREVKRTRQQKLMLFVALAVNACTHSFLLIILPILGRNLAFSDSQTGLLIGMSALLLALSGPFWGRYSDKRGRRRVIAIGLGAAAIFPMAVAVVLIIRPLQPVTPVLIFAVLLFIRIFQACTSGGLMPAAQAWLADHTDLQKRAQGMAFMGASFGCGSIIGAGLAWGLAGKEVVMALCCLSVILVLVAIGIHFILQMKTDKPENKENMAFTNADAHLEPLKVQTIWPYLVTTICGLIVYSMLMQITPLRLADEFGFSSQIATQQSGKIMLMTLVGMVLMQGSVMRWGRSPILLLQYGAVVAVVSMIFVATAMSVDWLTVATILLGMSLGVLLPGNLALLSLAANKTAQARAAGTNAVAQGIGMAIGPIGGGALYQQFPESPYFLGIFVLCVICLLSLFVQRRLLFAI